MKTLQTSKFRADIAKLIESREPCLITKHERPVGVYIPLSNCKTMVAKIRVAIKRAKEHVVLAYLLKGGK